MPYLIKMPSPYYKVLPWGLFPEQVPIPFYKRHSFWLSIYLLLQFGFLVFLLLASQPTSANANNDGEGNNQQGNNDPNLGQPEHHHIQPKDLPDWQNCVIPAKVNDKVNCTTNCSKIVDIKCAEKIPNFIRDNDIQNISKEGEFRSLSMCWKMASSYGNKFSSRYKLKNSPNSINACSKFKNDEENTNIHGLELKWKHQNVILSLNDGHPTDITSIVNDKFNGCIDQFLHCLFTPNCSMDNRDSINEEDFYGNANDGAMFADYPLDVIHLEFSMQLTKLEILWDIVEPKGEDLDNITREQLLEKCKKQIDEWNKCGFQKHIWNEESKKACLMSPKEWRARMGIDESINPNPEGKNQTWGGPDSTGPIEPIPLRPTRPDQWNSHSKETFNFTLC